MVVYFSGTGNSRYCAKLLADRLHDTSLDPVPFIRDGIAAELSSQTPWVFVTPTYSWQIPRVFADFLRSGWFSGCRDAYFVMTCGEDIGNAPQENRRLCQQIGLTYRGTLSVVMPENYIAMFAVPGEEEARRIVEAARPVLEQGSVWIRERAPFPPQKASLLDRLKSGPVNVLFYRFNVRSKPFRVSKSCVSCGKCQQVCPLGNIQLREGKPVWGRRCTHCMACICLCPVEAIEYGRSSQGKPRYQCPEYRK